jgi:hypothetical protein
MVEEGARGWGSKDVKRGLPNISSAGTPPTQPGSVGDRGETGHSPVREPTQADHDDVISGRVLSGDGLHAICPAAGDDCDTLSIVGLLEAGGKIVHDVLKRDAHVVEGPVRVHDRVLEESIGVDVVKEGRHPKYEDSLPVICRI